MSEATATLPRQRELIDQLIQTNLQTVRMQVGFASVGIVLAIVAFGIGMQQTGLAKMDMPKAASVVIAALTTFPITLIQKPRGRIVCLRGLKLILDDDTQGKQGTASAEWVDGIVRKIISNELTGGSD